MARRLYFDRTNAPSVSPAYDASWEVTGDAGRRQLTRTKAGQTASSNFAQTNDTSGSADVLIRQFVSEPLAPQTISGTVWAWFLVRDSSASSADARSQLVVKVVSGDGSTVRGTLLGHDTGGLTNQWPTSAAARAFPKGATSGASVSSVNAHAGDRLVVEVGWRRHYTGSGFRSAVITVSSNGSDITASEVSTTGDPWVEFSHDLVFLDELNTEPEITVPPTVDYGSYTRTGPQNTPISVTFEAEDDEEDGTDELTVEVRTAASGGGTLVATDDYTSGTSGSISIAHNASGLSEGSNTLYMRVGDGTDWSDDESFTLLVDRGAPTVGTINQSPNPAVP